MGKFGQSICVELSKMGAEVLAVDQDEDLVDQVKDQVERAAVADLCDPESIKKLGIADMDTVIVTMSTSMEASILCCMVSKEAGVKHVVAKAKDKLMGQILKRVGADDIIYPEEESAKRNAYRLISSEIRDFFNIQDTLSLIEMVPKASWVGHNLIELNLRRKFGMNVIGIKPNGTTIENPDPERKIEEGDTLLVIRYLRTFGDRPADNLLLQCVDDHDASTLDSEFNYIKEHTRQSFLLLALKVNSWNHDLSPWKAPPVWGDEGFGDGAAGTLSVVDSVITDALPDLADSPSIYLGGYSLAGLFSLWAGYQRRFDGIVAVNNLE